MHDIKETGARSTSSVSVYRERAR